jgi:tetratricopeptide (TPR) repeat protein
MRYAPVIICIALLQLFVHSPLAAQTTPQSINAEIGNIESYMFQNPTQGKADFLQLLHKYPDAPDSCKGFIYLDLATTYGMINRLDSGLWAADLAVKLLKDNIEVLGALKTKVILYRIGGDYPNAEKFITESLSLNETRWKNQSIEATLLQEYASLCSDQGKYFNATQLMLKALALVRSGQLSGKSPYDILKIQLNLAEIYSKAGNHSFAIKVFEEIMPRLDSLHDYDRIVRTGCQMAESYIFTERFTSADSLTTILLALAKTMNNDELVSYVTLLPATALSAQHRYAESLPHYRRTFDLMLKNQSAYLLKCAIPYLTALKYSGGEVEAKGVLMHPELQQLAEQAQPEVLVQLRRITAHFNWNEMAIDELHNYYEKILNLTDSVSAQKNKHLTLEIMSKYQFEEQEKNAQQLAKENDLLRTGVIYKRNQIILISLLAALLSITVILLIVRHRQRTRIRVKQLKLQEQEIVYQKQQNEWARQEKNYRDQLLEQQKAALTEAITNSEALKTQLQQLVEERDIERRKELVVQFSKAKESKAGLDELLFQFNKIHPEFTPSLRQAFPKLSLSDVQFCILYRMNLSTKEISALMHVESRSVYIKKYRIMEKMNLGKDVDFDSVIFKDRV